MGDIYTIPLTLGYVAIVDAEDYEWLRQWNWVAREGSSGPTYAVRYDKTRNRCRHDLFMHRVILDAPLGLTVDHINHNGLDNRRSNLRLATLSQQNMNRPLQSNNKVGFKGVRRSTRPNLKRPYEAYIVSNRKQRHLGMFVTAEEAALAYDRAAVELFGEFACLNHPEKAFLDALDPRNNRPPEVDK